MKTTYNRFTTMMAGLVIIFTVTSCSSEQFMFRYQKANTDNAKTVSHKANKKTSIDEVNQALVQDHESTDLAVMAPEGNVAATSALEDANFKKEVTKSDGKNLEKSEVFVRDPALTALNGSTNSAYVVSPYENSLAKLIQKQANKKNVKHARNQASTEVVLLYVLAVLLPPLAVGIVTDWAVLPLVVSIILWLLFFIPGIIFAIIVVSRNT